MMMIYNKKTVQNREMHHGMTVANVASKTQVKC